MSKTDGLRLRENAGSGLPPRFSYLGAARVPYCNSSYISVPGLQGGPRFGVKRFLWNGIYGHHQVGRIHHHP
jgi:hypothetical protein